MRIAVVANTAWYLVNFRLNLMKALQAAGHQVVAVAPLDEFHAERIQSTNLLFEPVAISGAGTNPIGELQTVWSLRQVFKRYKVQLVLSYTPKGNLYSAMACMSLDIPFVSNVSGLGRSFIQENWVTLIVKLLYRFTLGRAHKVFFQNLDDMAIFVKSELVSRDRCERLPGSGVELSRFCLQPMPDHTQDAPVFLLVARLLWDKGVGEFVEAARQLLLRYPKVKFQLLGFVDVDNPSAVPRTMVQKWEAEGLLTYLGSTQDVRPYLANADCVVLPSYREGVPRTLLEAAAIGRPVITTDVPGCRDTVIDGVTGWICRPRDAMDLCRCLMAFVNEPLVSRLAMGQRGRQRVEAEFDERTVIGTYLRLVQELSCK